MNPLNYTGPEFLWFYVQCAFWLFVGRGIVTLQRVLVRTVEPSEYEKLQPYELAWMTGGIPGVAGAVTVALKHAELISFSGGKLAFVRSLSAGEQRETTLEPIEREVLAQLRNRGTMPQSEVREIVKNDCRQIENKMTENGFAATTTVRGVWRLFGSYGWIALILSGVLKVVVGILRAKPVGFLLLILSLSALIAWMLRASVRLSKAGEEALKYHRAEAAALRETAPTAPTLLSHGEAVTGYALFGSTALIPGLAGVWTPDYHVARSAGYSGGSSWTCSSSGSSSGSSCGSSCGGGCGGCGG